MASCTELPAGINKLLEQQLQQLDFAFVISDATAADMPICFASSKFYEMTGYQPTEVIGKNCRFLQGKDTEKRKVG
jgi:PAS domain-containing protein